MAYLWAGVGIVLCLISYFGLIGSKNAGPSSRKAQQAKAMKEAFKSIDNENGSSKQATIKQNAETLKISQLWIYPIKSIRGCQVPTAMLTQEGFYLDRRFMLLKDHEETPQKLENMHITKYPSMCLFHPSIKDNNTLVVTYRPPAGKSSGKANTLEIPFEPQSLDTLERVPVIMHSSPTTGYNMGERYNKWLSERFGFRVVLAYWGGNPRPVLGNLPGKPANQGRRSANTITKVLSSIPVIGPMLEEDDGVIAFNDCAPYLVINESSVADVSTRLPSDVEMDLTKFRANIVVSGLAEAYSEDFWGELTFGDAGSKIILTGNCGRCKSLNVDYHTGESGTGRDGEVLKLLQKDRRVDPGVKYSPIFGRYGFVSKGDEGGVLRVGDEVIVSRKNEERTKFYWPGIST
ncbi:MOSC domain-containing protein [Rhexocercosporidium sp. MPI-PUGE-AT-0058]|nr:MOSC domain-containing protein [Rhexocercosporidium sp. MPI-PUGE-AT-0058]